MKIERRYRKINSNINTHEIHYHRVLNQKKELMKSSLPELIFSESTPENLENKVKVYN